MVINRTLFGYNSASTNGGAIHTTGSVVALDTSFIGNNAPGAVYTTSTFTGENINFKDNDVLDFTGTGATSATCTSGCHAGEFGNCSIASGSTLCYATCDCQDCPSGTFEVDVDSYADQCTNCTAGEYQPAIGSTSCLSCPNGTDSPFGSPACYAPSPAPTFLPTNTPTLEPSFVPTIYTAPPSSLPTFPPSTSPTPLPTLSPSPSPTPLPTIQCEQGYYLDSLTCYACPIGRYSTINTPPFASSCTLCESGKYQATTGSNYCLDCVSGKYSKSDRTECDACSAGTYVFNASSCENCPLGNLTLLTLSHSFIVSLSNYLKSLKGNTLRLLW